jgi:hypothetical protein
MHSPFDERLRDAFQAAVPRGGEACSEQDLDRIWRAVAAELPAHERRELVERVAADPAFAEAWRIAREIRNASSASPADVHARRWRVTPAPWLAAAAVLLLGVASALFVVVNRPRGDTYREQGSTIVESLVSPETTLPREDFQLRWTPGPSGSRHDLRVLTQDLRLLASATGLTVPEFVVEPGLLGDLPAGTRVLWQVDVTLATGVRVSSQTFVVRVQ